MTTTRNRSLTIILVAMLAVAVPVALAHDQIPGKPQDAPILLKGGDLYTVSDGVMEGTDLLFDGGEITRIGKNLTPPPGAKVVDVSGKRVYPGLIAAATTIGLTEIGAVRATNDLDEVGGVTPEVLAHVAYNPDSEVIPTVRSNGITTAQVKPAGSSFSNPSVIVGRSFITYLDGWTKEDSGIKLIDALHVTWPSARVSTSFFAPPIEKQKERMKEQRDQLRKAFDGAKAYASAKKAGVEVETNLAHEAMMAALDGEIPVIVDADDYRQIVEAISFAKERGLRLIILGGLDAWMATDLLKANDVPVIIKTVQQLPQRADDDYDAVYRLPKMLHDAGVTFCMTRADSWDSRNLPLEGGQAVAYGLPKEVALRSITLSAAEVLGIADREGSLEVGKKATLFVSEGDVMDTLGHRVTHMWIEGRWVDLDNRHKALFRKYSEKPGN